MTLPPTPGVPWDGRHDAQLGYRQRCRAWLREREPAAAGGDWGERLRRAGIEAQLAWVLARGLLHDVLPHASAGYQAIDHVDFRCWLERWGARAAGHDFAPVRALYDLAFAYPDGVRTIEGGQLAAGAALRALLALLFKYRGAPFWRMRAGMGDTVFAPLYRVLTARGVGFEFFHQVLELHPAPALQALSGIELCLHSPPAGVGYQPLISVRGLPCWPREPLWAQLEPGAQRSLRCDSSAAPLARRRRLQRGVHFDVAILAIPPACHPRLARELLDRSEPLRQMVEHSHSVSTVAAQVWLGKPLAELGWPRRGTIYTSGAGGLGNWADMSEVLPYEAWQGAHQPQSVVYFCDVSPGPSRARDPQDQARALLEETLDRHATGLWKRSGSPGRFDRTLLFAGLHNQYCQYNSQPSNRYVLTLPGTTKYRLAPDESGFDGLFLAGDWTRSSINGGSVEAAVESGQRAAQAIIARWG